jgi:hypothetical protein
MSLDLRTARPVWLINRKQIAGHRKLAKNTKNISCEVTVAGGSVSGGLIVHNLASLGTLRETGEKPASAECYGMKLKCVCKRMIVNEIVVEATGVEPASENVTGQETTCLFAFMPQSLECCHPCPGRSRPTLRTDKKR